MSHSQLSYVLAFSWCKRLFLHSLDEAPKLMSKSSHNQQWRHSQYRNCTLRNLPLSSLVTAASSKFSRYV